jgi:MFS family permease
MRRHTIAVRALPQEAKEAQAMREALRNPSYAKLFSAQVVALLGTGILTIALGLLAFDIAGGDAGIVLGIALTIKMLAYVGVAPIVSALIGHLPRKPVLITADIVRAVIAISLPFVTDAWQIYVLIFILQAASATFTPAFQAVIPEVLPDETQYTHALSLSRMAYDLEALISPLVAAALLTVLSYNNLFVGTFLGFVGSAVLVFATTFPRMAQAPPTRFVKRLTRGARIFWQTPELRSLILLNVVVASATATVIVNTVVLVQGELGRSQADVALLFAAYGVGSMAVALTLPAMLEKVSDRKVMLAGAFLLPIILAGVAWVIVLRADSVTWVALMGLWLVLGAATSLILTPSGRLLRRAGDESERPAIFAAQFSISHACYMITYPIAGVVGTFLGLPATTLLLAVIGVVAALTARAAWVQSVPVSLSPPQRS